MIAGMAVCVHIFTHDFVNLFEHLHTSTHTPENRPRHRAGMIIQICIHTRTHTTQPAYNHTHIHTHAAPCRTKIEHHRMLIRTPSFNYCMRVLLLLLLLLDRRRRRRWPGGVHLNSEQKHKTSSTTCPYMRCRVCARTRPGKRYTLSARARVCVSVYTHNSNSTACPCVPDVSYNICLRLAGVQHPLPSTSSPASSSTSPSPSSSFVSHVTHKVLSTKRLN